MNLADTRTEYRRSRLRRGDLAAEPVRQFETWLQDAIRVGVGEPTAMSLATATADGRPLVRTVLLKGLDARGFVFFTNLGSRKARHLADNPHASLLFPWLALERQVIVVGTAERLPAAEALRYFASRPRESQLAAWASPQSAVLGSRAALEQAWEQMKRRFADGRIPLPSFWGGFRVRPETIEFWQGGPHRLHDRFVYRRASETEPWCIERLAP